MRLSIFGRREIEVTKRDGVWNIFYLGEGKKRKAEDILIPADVEDEQVIEYLNDLLHEWATPERPEITVITP